MGTYYPVKSQSVHIPVRDGVTLSAHVHRPDAVGRFPAIVSYTPYRKGPLGAHHPIVTHGYATVNLDIRGTGDSSGWNDSIYSAAEREDGYDVIEWAAAQPWCNGNVGMWGISFGAVVALQMAGVAPPHLKAIIARSGTDDPYTEWTNPGGSPRPYMYTCYAPIMSAANFSPPDPGELGERWAEVWEERLEHNVPWGISFIGNLADGPFWRERSLRGKYDQVQCAVFVVAGWADWYATPLLRVFANLKGPKRALVGPWSHQFPDKGIPAPRVDWLHECLKWFDYWLKGIENGAVDEPPITIFVREYSKPSTILIEDKGRFRCEDEWPIARGVETPLHLHPNGDLASSPARAEGHDAFEYDSRVGASAGMHGGGPFNINWAMPLDQRPDELDSLVYTGELLEEETEVVGQPRVVLFFSSTAPVALLVAKLCDVAPDGTSALVSKGYLNVTHRESHTRPSAIEPGKVYEVEFDLLACAYRFAVGHRMRLDIAASDFLNIWPTPMACTNVIHCGPARASRVILPVIPSQEPEQPRPALKPSPIPPPRLEDMEAPEFLVTRNIIDDTSTVRFQASFGPRWSNTGAMTVSARNPAEAIVRARSQCGHHYPGRHIVVDAHCVTSSDERAFHHTVDVAITVNDVLFYERSWSASVSRQFT